jgi:hypothetical protein
LPTIPATSSPRKTYLTYVRTCGRYDSESREAHIEYSQLPDAVEISVYRDRDAS